MDKCPACNKKLNKEFVNGVFIMSCKCGFVNKANVVTKKCLHHFKRNDDIEYYG